MKKLLTALFIFCCCATQAQFKKPYFNTLDVKSGLPEAAVRATLEDKNGYLWMPTQSGLVRYDGYQFKPYPMRNSKGNIVSPNSIQRVVQDAKGKIWAYTRETGIHYYNPQTDQFVLALPVDTKTFEAISQTYLNLVDDITHDVHWLLLQNFVTQKTSVFKFNTVNYMLQNYTAINIGNKQLSINEPRTVIKDAVGKIWLAADSSLSYFDDATGAFKHYFTLPKSLHDSLIYQLVADPVDANIVWMNTYNSYQSKNFKPALLGKNLLRFNLKTKTFQCFTPNADNASALPAGCTRILTDSLKRLWVATEKGISLYNATQNNFTNFAIEFNHNAPVVATICADKTGNLWIGGNFKNLYYLNLQSGISQQIERNTYEGSLPPFGAGINKIFYDRSGTLWVSMPFYGIARFDQQKTLFAPTLIAPTNSGVRDNRLGNPLKIKGSQGDSICFVADTTDLYAWHSRSNQYDRIDLKNKDAHKNISAVVVAGNGSLWIAAYGVGLFNYNPITRVVKKWENKPNDSLSLISNNVNRLAVDKEGKLWIGTLGKGLCSYNPYTERFSNYPFILNNNYNKPENALDDDEVLSLMIDSEDIVWIGTNNGALNSFDPKTTKFKSYLDKDKGFFCVAALLQDSKKRMWAGTYLSGLFLIDPQKGIIKRYNENDGLLYNGVYSLLEDNSGNIWCSTYRGYTRLNPDNNRINNFPIALKVYGGNLTYFYKDAAGTFYQSFKDGVVSLNPSDLKPNVIVPSVLIESIRYKADKTGQDTILYTQANQNIVLSHNENKIEFTYVALHFVDPENNKYSYQLMGYDKDWVLAGTQRTATYTNLSPGTYHFKVKACNSDGVWNETATSISIQILPPWWKTWWAYLLYALLFILLVGGYISFRSRKLKRENAFLEEKIAHRTSMLQKSLEDLKSTQSQLVQSEKMASLGELTAGIAHEIQNPLNFVNNFSEVNKELLVELKDEIKKGNMDEVNAIADNVISNEEKINHHGKRADAIVKGMLQHSRSTNNATKEPTDINALADEYLRLAYHGLRAKDKSFNATMKTDFDETIGNINIIPQDIGRVILNLITNAFYVVDEKKTLRQAQGDNSYEPTVSVTTKKIADKVEIKVADNGNGIPQKVLDKIFQPFFTTKPTGQGTGLGLSLSYDIVKAHGGEIKVETKDGEGTEFIIQIPKS